MRVAVRLPDLGIGPVQFGLWLVEPGEHVYEGDRLAEVLMPGVSVDVAAPATGTLIERIAYPRDLLTAGQVIGFVESEADASA
jgi:pyruvate/2-oxoglutarate dehydrogenase complex dihydrolipoamide acyltransferase (E2) component